MIHELFDGLFIPALLYKNNDSKKVFPIKSALKKILILSGPIILGQISQMLIGVGDVYVASLYSTQAVAAVGVAVGIFNPILLFGTGLAMGISALFSIKRGEGKNMKGQLSSVLAYSSIIGLLLSFILLGLNTLVPYFGIKNSLVPSIQTYISIIAWSIIPSTVFQGLKEYMQSFEKVMAANLLTLAAVFINVLANYLLVFGFGSFSGLGELGLPIASLIIRILLCVSLLSYLLYKENLETINHKLNWELFKFSLPIAFAFFLEVLAFSLVSVLSGKLSVAAAAANSIVLTIASTLFMIPLSIASAASVKIGQAYGIKNKLAISTYIKAVLIITISYSFMSFSLLALAPEWLLRLFSQDLKVIQLGVGVCAIVAIFQFVDGIQVACSGILRGLNETLFPTLMVFLSYWFIGIPMGIYLTFYNNYGIKGLWVGLALGLASASVGLGVLLRKRFIRTMKLIDEAP